MNGHAPFTPTSKPNIGGAKQIQGEHPRQYQASRASGIPVEWRVAEPGGAALACSISFDNSVMDLARAGIPVVGEWLVVVAG
jgi:hypothetical protein